MLPVNDSEKPDFAYMERYVKLLMKQQLMVYLNHKKLTHEIDQSGG